MVNDVRLDFEIHWKLNISKVQDDPTNRVLRSLGNKFPYRVFLTPTNEMLCERTFDLYDRYYTVETHHLQLDHGQWAISIVDVTGWLDLTVKNVRLNTVRLPGDTTVFTL